jgi:hypothetical protein
VPSHLNPVDAATRDSSMDIILSAINVWLKGPEYILLKILLLGLF